MLVARSGGAACSWGPITQRGCKRLALSVGAAGRPAGEAALSAWARHVPCAGPPQAWGLVAAHGDVPAPQQGCVPMTACQVAVPCLCCHREEQSIGVTALQ